MKHPFLTPPLPQFTYSCPQSWESQPCLVFGFTGWQRSYSGALPAEFTGSLPSKFPRNPLSMVHGKVYCSRELTMKSLRSRLGEGAGHWMLLATRHCRILALEKPPGLQEPGAVGSCWRSHWNLPLVSAPSTDKIEHGAS